MKNDHVRRDRIIYCTRKIADVFVISGGYGSRYSLGEIVYPETSNPIHVTIDLFKTLDDIV